MHILSLFHRRSFHFPSHTTPHDSSSTGPRNRPQHPYRRRALRVPCGFVRALRFSDAAPQYLSVRVPQQHPRPCPCCPAVALGVLAHESAAHRVPCEQQLRIRSSPATCTTAVAADSTATATTHASLLPVSDRPARPAAAVLPEPCQRPAAPAVLLPSPRPPAAGPARLLPSRQLPHAPTLSVFPLQQHPAALPSLRSDGDAFRAAGRRVEGTAAACPGTTHTHPLTHPHTPTHTQLYVMRTRCHVISSMRPCYLISCYFLSCHRQRE